MIKNLANKTVKKTLTPSAINENVEKTSFVPIKDKIKQMEQQNNKHSYEPEKCELELKFNEIVKESNLIIEDELIESKENSLIDLIEECSTGSNGTHNGTEINNKHQNGTVTVPPKPLPRTSRTNSVSDQGQEEINNGINGSIPRPAPRPRTTAGSYKVDIDYGFLLCLDFFVFFFILHFCVEHVFLYHFGFTHIFFWLVTHFMNVYTNGDINTLDTYF